MIDTVKLSIPYDEIMLNSLRNTGSKIQRVDSIGFTDELKVSDAIPIPPYNRTVQLHLNNVPFARPLLYLEFSVPKICNGTNVYMISVEEFEETFEKVCLILQDRYEGISRPENWIVQRLDICHSWKFGSPQIAQRHLDFIKLLDYPRKNKHTYTTTAMFTGRSFTLRFYIKQPEYLTHDFKFLKYDFLDEAIKAREYCANMIRFETEIRKPELLRIFGKPINYKELLNKDFYTKQLQFYLSTFNYPKFDLSLKKFERFQNIFSITKDSLELNDRREPIIQAEL